MIRGAALLLAAMGVALVATSEPALAQDRGNCAAGSCRDTLGGALIFGTSYSDGLHGLGGNDLIRGFGANDILTGGDGDDALHGDSGDDWVEGDAGDDLVTGAGGDDLIKGGSGDDRVIGASGGDVLRGGRGADRIEAQDGFADVISCGAGSKDLIFFDQDLDSVATDCESPVALAMARAPSKAARPKCTPNRNHLFTGHNGPDTLYGDCYHDVVIGYGGNDTLFGGKGPDDLWGGRGRDTCVSGEWHDCE